MRAIEIEKNLNNKIDASYLLMVDEKTGEDEALRSFVKEKILNLVPKEERSFSYINIELDETKNFASVIENANTFNFSQCPKIIDVRPFSYKLTKDDEKLLREYMNEPQDNTIILFEGSNKNLDMLSKYCTLVDCTKALEDELFHYVVDDVIGSNYKIEMRVARSFVQKCNLDFGKITTELYKLKLYCQEKRTIEEGDIDSLIVLDPEYIVYQLTNFLSDQKYDEALEMIQKVKERDSFANRIPGEKKVDVNSQLFSNLTNTYRRYFELAFTAADDDTIFRTLGVNQRALFMQRKTVASNKTKIPNYTLKLKAIVEYLNELEYKYKMSKITPEQALDLGVAKIIAIQKG